MRLEIVNNAKSFESVLLLILKWPLTGLVESSIVRMNCATLIAPSAWSLMNMYVARVTFALLNRSWPAPGFASAVLVLNV